MNTHGKRKKQLYLGALHFSTIGSIEVISDQRSVIGYQWSVISFQYGLGDRRGAEASYQASAIWAPIDLDDLRNWSVME